MTRVKSNRLQEQSFEQIEQHIIAKYQAVGYKEVQLEPASFYRSGKVKTYRVRADGKALNDFWIGVSKTGEYRSYCKAKGGAA